jgi:hypothetical protein
VVILEVQLNDLLVLDPECQPSVASDVQAPGAFAVARQPVCLPQRKAAQFLRLFHRLDEREHLAELVHDIRTQAS